MKHLLQYQDAEIQKQKEEVKKRQQPVLPQPIPQEAQYSYLSQTQPQNGAFNPNMIPVRQTQLPPAWETVPSPQQYQQMQQQMPPQVHQYVPQQIQPYQNQQMQQYQQHQQQQQQYMSAAEPTYFPSNSYDDSLTHYFDSAEAEMYQRQQPQQPIYVEPEAHTMVGDPMQPYLIMDSATSQQAQPMQQPRPIERPPPDIIGAMQDIDIKIKAIYERANDSDPLNASFDRRCQGVLKAAIQANPDIPQKSLHQHWYGKILDQQMAKKRKRSQSPPRNGRHIHNEEVNMAFKRGLPDSWTKGSSSQVLPGEAEQRNPGRVMSPDLHVFKSHLHAKLGRVNSASSEGPSPSRRMVQVNNQSNQPFIENQLYKATDKDSKQPSNFMTKFSDNDTVAQKRQAALESYRRALDQQMEEKKIREENKKKKESSPDHVPYPQENAVKPEDEQQNPDSEVTGSQRRLSRRNSRGQPRSKNISQLRHQFSFRDGQQDEASQKKIEEVKKQDEGTANFETRPYGPQINNLDFSRLNREGQVGAFTGYEPYNIPPRAPPTIEQLSASANHLISMMQNVVSETVASTQFQHFQLQQLLQAEASRVPGVAPNNFLPLTFLPQHQQLWQNMQPNPNLAPPHLQPQQQVQQPNGGQLEGSSEVLRLPTMEALNDLPPELQSQWLQKYKDQEQLPIGAVQEQNKTQEEAKAEATADVKAENMVDLSEEKVNIVQTQQPKVQHALPSKIHSMSPTQEVSQEAKVVKSQMLTSPIQMPYPQQNQGPGNQSSNRVAIGQMQNANVNYRKIFQPNINLFGEQNSMAEVTGGFPGAENQSITFQQSEYPQVQPPDHMFNKGLELQPSEPAQSSFNQGLILNFQEDERPIQPMGTQKFSTAIDLNQQVQPEIKSNKFAEQIADLERQIKEQRSKIEGESQRALPTKKAALTENFVQMNEQTDDLILGNPSNVETSNNATMIAPATVNQTEENSTYTHLYEVKNSFRGKKKKKAPRVIKNFIPLEQLEQAAAQTINQTENHNPVDKDALQKQITEIEQYLEEIAAAKQNKEQEELKAVSISTQEIFVGGGGGNSESNYNQQQEEQQQQAEDDEKFLQSLLDKPAIYQEPVIEENTEEETKPVAKSFMMSMKAHKNDSAFENVFEDQGQSILKRNQSKRSNTNTDQTGNNIGRIISGKKPPINKKPVTYHLTKLSNNRPTPHQMMKEHQKLETQIEKKQFAANRQEGRQIPGMEDLEDQEKGAGQVESAEWNQIVEREENEFDVYSSVFKRGGGEVSTPRVFEDDPIMPSSVNLSLNQFSAAVESGDAFQQQIAGLQQSFDHIMHQNFQLEQQMNQKYLQRQSTAPGNVSAMLHNSRDVMNQILSTQSQKEALQKGTLSPEYMSIKSYNIAANSFGSPQSHIMAKLGDPEKKVLINKETILAHEAFANVEGVASRNLDLSGGLELEDPRQAKYANDFRPSQMLQEEQIPQNPFETEDWINQSPPLEDLENQYIEENWAESQSYGTQLQNRLYNYGPSIQKAHDMQCEYGEEYATNDQYQVFEHEEEQDQLQQQVDQESKIRSAEMETSAFARQVSASDKELGNNVIEPSDLKSESIDIKNFQQLVTPPGSNRLGLGSDKLRMINQLYQEALDMNLLPTESSQPVLYNNANGPPQIKKQSSAKQQSARSNQSQQDIINQHALAESEASARRQKQQSFLPPIPVSANQLFRRSNSLNSGKFSPSADQQKRSRRLLGPSLPKIHSQPQLLKNSGRSQSGGDSRRGHLPPLPSR